MYVIFEKSKKIKKLTSKDPQKINYNCHSACENKLKKKKHGDKNLSLKYKI